jgi:N-acetylglucosaminyltransferase
MSWMPVPFNGLTVVLPVYLALALTYSRAQRRFGKRTCSQIPAAPNHPYQPSVDVIVPCYNEEPALLAACLGSLSCQDYEGDLNVWVVDDGSYNQQALLRVFENEADAGWRIELLSRNNGKRAAQDAVFGQACGEILLTIDSDTSIAPDAVRRIVAPFRNPRVGAVCGRLRASNSEATWLTRLINTRYRLLFERERAAQGFFGAVLCCAGPFAAYRREVIDQVWSQYIPPIGNSRPLLEPPGDDLALTNLVLERAFDSVYEPTATAATYVPATLRQFLRQQRRWNRSFYRALPRMLRLAVRRQKPYLAVDLTARALLPGLLAYAVLATAVDAVVAPSRLPWDAVALTAMASVALDLGPSSGWAERHRFVVLYGLVFVVLLLPTRLAAICTLFRNHWETRKPSTLIE